MNLFEFTIDGFRISQLIITLVVFGFSLYFTKGYFKETGEGKGARFYIVTLITMLSVIGVFVSASLFTLFVFFEIMSISSYFWVLERGDKAAEKASKFYLAVSVISGMAMLMGLFLLYNSLGTLRIDEIQEATNSVDISSLYLGGALTLVGFCTKAGMYPLHIWLVDTYYETPAPGTAMLSAVLSKAGVFGVILVSCNIFIADENWGKILLIFATITMIWGGLCGVVSADMKKTIAYSSMSQIGFILFGIAMCCILEEEKIIAARGIVLHMINHSAFKLILFTLCGVALMKFKSTKLENLKGIARQNKVFAISFVIAAAGLMGVPFISSGYISKTLLHESVVEQIHLTELPVYSVYEYLFLFSGGLTVCYMLKIALVIFAKPSSNKKFSMGIMTNAVLLAISAFAFVCGILPNMTIDKIADYTTEIFNSGEMHDTISYFTWTNLKGAVISISCGLILYFFVYKNIQKIRKSDTIIPEILTLKNIYTNIFARDIPLILGFICKLLDTYLIDYLLKLCIYILELYAKITSGLADTFIDFLILVGLKPARVVDLNDRTTNSYKVGRGVDKILAILRIKTQKPIAETLSDFERRSSIRRRMISASLSYGLFFAGVGLVGLLVYMMLA